ncbi:MAG: penicillin-binding protein 2, partial [Blautia sp.]|nr:penicillin-binding protein 2 [Blautia sp.]
MKMKKLRKFEEEPILKKEAFEEEQKPVRKKRKINREYAMVSAFFIVMFLGLIAYLIYFQVEISEDFINSPYNTRQDTFSDRVVRGRIVSSDDETLAYTEVYEDGSEERVYPCSNVFAHVVGYDSNGKSGLEAEANYTLLTSHTFFLDQMKNEFKGIKNTGDTVVTSLNASMQRMAYNLLGERRGAIIAIEPKTGRIICEVSKPDFDPNYISYNYSYIIQDENDSSLLNRATNGAYPPGSTFKIVDVLDYYRHKGTLDGYQYICEGTITQGGHMLSCYNGTVHGQENLYEAFASSCNCAFARIGLQLGAPSLIKTAEDLLFNRSLPFTTYRTSTFPLRKDSPVAVVMQTAIGQGDTLVSPAHLALITCAVANNGLVMKPSLIDEVRSVDGEVVKTYQPVPWKQIITA